MEISTLLRWLGSILFKVVDSLGLPLWVAELLQMISAAAIVLGAGLLVVLFLVWWERKLSGHFQQRFGPMRTGWHGWIQTVVDGVKLLQKEDIIPKTVDRKVFFWAPVLCFSVSYAAFAVIPWGQGLWPTDLNIGILYILAVTTFVVIALLMAGWSSNNKYALLGGMRAAAQIISYEVPLMLSILGVIMLVQSLSMVKIVEAQGGIFGWFIFKQPLGFLIYLVAATAETNRAPFDIPEAEQELVAGFNIEYSGMKFAMFFMAEFLNLFLVAAIATTIFLGGWRGPWLPSWVWFMGKTLFLVFVIIWFKWTYPRLRVDQLMEFCWKVLLPLAFLNLIVSGILFM
ncbi:MAG: NADH-quinone oxidoreductase subunit NuoH [candidate division Zixibacteria bacterium]|nr:NADH-quinone oxidoreductase subunit NuoH [candidate division Zixibacteria bacterium]